VNTGVFIFLQPAGYGCLPAGDACTAIYVDSIAVVEVNITVDANPVK
jgi:hypothetical protein